LPDPKAFVRYGGVGCGVERESSTREDGGVLTAFWLEVFWWFLGIIFNPEEIAWECFGF
jgi:hypothetical protein